MSGLLASTPVSSTPTVTRRSPGSILRAWSARTIVQPQSLSSSGSMSGLRRGGGAPAALELPSVSTLWFFWNERPMEISWAAPVRAGDAAAFSTKPVAGALTVNMPTVSLLRMTVPPIFAMAAAASALETLSAATTVYSVVAVASACAGLDSPPAVRVSVAAMTDTPVSLLLNPTGPPWSRGWGYETGETVVSATLREWLSYPRDENGCPFGQPCHCRAVGAKWVVG